MDESQIDDILQVSLEENSLLTTEYSEEGVRKAVFYMEHDKALGQDSFPAEFYQVLSNTIKSDLLALFSCLHARQLELFRLNFGEIIFLPKINEAERIQHMDLSACLMLVSKFHKNGHLKTEHDCRPGILSIPDCIHAREKYHVWGSNLA
jgi:hypothetical protein